MADSAKDQTPATPKAASSYVDAMAALAKAAEEGDERARKALKKMADAADDGESDKDEKKDGDKDAKASKAEGGEKKDDEKKEDAGAKASSSNSLESDIRAALIASRPDLANDAKLQAKFQAASIADLKVAVETMPKAAFKAPAQPEAGTRGESQKDGGRFAPVNPREELAERMGLGASKAPRVTRGDGITVFRGSREQVSIAIEQYQAARSAGGSK
jgi:hypothetical protein